MRTELVVDLHQSRPPGSIGTKAENLRLLMQSGFQTPAALVCPWEAHEQYLEGREDLIGALKAELLRHLKPGMAYAVRSSANVEDSSDHSFAGQFKSILNIRGVDQVVEAIRSVWAAAQSANVRAYAEKKGAATGDLGMAVIIQEMVEPVMSGVSFSKNPVTGLDEIVVEAVAGSGEALVQQGVTPRRWINKWGEWIVRPEQDESDLAIVEQVVRQTKAIAETHGRQGLQVSSPRSRGMNRMTDFVKRVRPKLFRALMIALGALLVIVLIGPFLVPIPQLESTVPPEQLADPDSRFVQVNGLKIHYKTAGAGEPTMILLHGFGASLFSWREVMEPLGEWGSVIAFDRPAFGLTERPLSWEEAANPYTPDAQVALLLSLMDTLDVDEAILVGNSAGGTVAVNAALAHPERFDALVLVDAAIYQGGGAPSWIRPLLRAPQVDRLGPLLARQIEARGDAFLEGAWHDPSKLTAEGRAGYRKPLHVENWDLALWEFTKASNQPDLVDAVKTINLPSLVISGDDDRVVPVESSVRLADELPNARLVVIPRCGHVPHEECPEPFLSAVETFLRDLPEN